MTKSKNKKRSVFTYKNFNNILMSSSIFNTLKKFREKKQVSRYFDLSSFDLSTLDQIKNNINSNDFGENKVIKYTKEVSENNNIVSESDILVQIELNHYINAIILNSFLNNLYKKLRDDTILERPVKNEIWNGITSHLNNYSPTLEHRLNNDFFKCYFVGRYNHFRSFLDFIIKRSRVNRVLKGVYFETLHSFKSVLEYLNWDIAETNKIYQCALTGLYFRFGLASTFYENIEPKFLLNHIEKENLLLFVGNKGFNNLYICNSIALGSQTLGYSKLNEGQVVKCFYISSKKTIVFENDSETLQKYPSINLTSNNNRLRSYQYKVVEGLPYAQLPFEKNKQDNLYLGVELEVNKSNRASKNIIKKLEEEILSGTAICKSDGSLGNNGLEINIVPMTLAYAKYTDYWYKFEKNVRDHLFSYRDKKTGLHVHVPKHLFTKYQIGLIGQFLNLRDNFDYVCSIAGRDLEHDTTFAKTEPRHDLKYFAFNDPERYSVLNTDLPKTIEFRLFKGNISATTIYRYLEFTHALCIFARSTSMNMRTHHKDFIKWVSLNKSDYPILNRFHLTSIEKKTVNARKVESFKVQFNKRFRNISFSVPTLRLAEPLKIRRVRAIRTRENIPLAYQTITTTTNER